MDVVDIDATNSSSLSSSLMLANIVVAACLLAVLLSFAVVIFSHIPVSSFWYDSSNCISSIVISFFAAAFRRRFVDAGVDGAARFGVSPVDVVAVASFFVLRCVGDRLGVAFDGDAFARWFIARNGDIIIGIDDDDDDEAKFDVGTELDAAANNDAMSIVTGDAAAAAPANMFVVTFIFSCVDDPT